MKNLICTEVSKQSWNDEKVTLQSDDFKVIMHVQNPDMHDQISVGDEFLTFEQATAKVSKAKKKKKK